MGEVIVITDRYDDWVDINITSKHTGFKVINFKDVNIESFLATNASRNYVFADIPLEILKTPFKGSLIYNVKELIDFIGVDKGLVCLNVIVMISRAGLDSVPQFEISGGYLKINHKTTHVGYKSSIWIDEDNMSIKITGEGETLMEIFKGEEFDSLPDLVHDYMYNFEEAKKREMIKVDE